MTGSTGTDRQVFVVDCMLGKLASYLLMLGYDTLYLTKQDRSKLLALGREERRLILSRDSALVPLSDLPPFLFIEDDLPMNQLKQVIRQCKLTFDRKQCFARCLRCNERLVPAKPEEVVSKVPSYIMTVHREFSICPQCERVYWRGTHQKKMEEMMVRVFTDQSYVEE